MREAKEFMKGISYLQEADRRRISFERPRVSYQRDDDDLSFLSLENIYCAKSDLSTLQLPVSRSVNQDLRAS